MSCEPGAAAFGTKSRTPRMMVLGMRASSHYRSRSEFVPVRRIARCSEGTNQRRDLPAAFNKYRSSIAYGSVASAVASSAEKGWPIQTC